MRALIIKSLIWMYFLLSATGRGRMTRPADKSSEQYGFFGKNSMLTGDSRVGRLDAVDVFIVRSPATRVDVKLITGCYREQAFEPGYFM